MKRLRKFPGKMLALVSAMGLSAAIAAPATPAPAVATSAAVYQRPSNSESIELSNLPEEGAVPLPIALDPAASVGTSAPEAKTAGTASAKPSPLKVKKKVLKKVTKPDGTEEEVWVETDEEVDNTEVTDPAAADSGAKQGERSASGASGNETASRVGSSAPASSGGGMSSGGFSSGGYAGGSTGETSNGAGGTTAPNGGSTGSGTTGAAGNGTGTNTASNGGSTGTGNTGTTGSGTTPAATTALETKLETYRNLMLNEVANAQVANPAITRRYQMMNRAAYQSRLGM
jgi:hypothetical protein